VKIVYFILAALATNFSIRAQTKEYKVKAGEYPARIIKADAYRFPEYRNGRLFNVNSKPSGNLLLNYNILLDEIRLIDKQGDTLAIGDPDLYPMIEIGNSQFHHDSQQGYFEIIDANKKIRFLEKQQFIIAQKDVVGSNGYGSTSSSPGAMVAATRNGSLPLTTVASADVTYTKKAFYYFSNNQGEIARANRSTLLKWYPDSREELKNFIREKGINFESEADIVKMMRFIGQLK
jgi:hypothetical protein